MKTIEEKAKAYDEAYKKVAVRFGSNVADEIFLEVKEVQEEHCTETEFREIEILRTKLSDIAKAIYYHEGKENPTVERIREIVQDCCFELMDLKKPKQEEPANEDLEKAAKHYLYSNILYDDVYVGNPTDKDCIEMFKAGAKWQFERVNEALLSEVLLCFMHGGEADEVVAKLEEVLNKKK